MHEGIPSTKSAKDDYNGKLEMLSRVNKQNLDQVIEQVRDDYLDGSVTDRFFNTRTVNWRVLVAAHLSGRGLVVGDHQEKVAILLSELLDEAYTVDKSLDRLRAQEAVAQASGTAVKPLHGEIWDLPFPADSFDVAVIQCRASEVNEFLTRVKKYLSPSGKALLLVDGWFRESGLAGLIGLGKPPDGLSDRIRASLTGHSFGVQRRVRREGFTVHEQYALLSTSRHENERLFDVESQAALNWLMRDSPKTSEDSTFWLVRMLSKFANKTGILQQCYPRYLFVCQPDGDRCQNGQLSAQESILISGKNRSTMLKFDDGKIAKIRKVPNSHWQSKLNENASAVTESISGPAQETIPRGEHVDTEFGAERQEMPVKGRPLDRSLEATPASVNHHIGMVFDWLVDLQSANTVTWIEKTPATVARELEIKDIGLSSPPRVEHSIDIPQVISHGDLYGSNIYIADDEVSYIIDWEWAKRKANPIADAGFFLLQLAEFLGDNFEDGFEQLFVDDTKFAGVAYTRIEEYCEQMGIAPTTFVIYLSIGYIDRIKKDLKFNKRLDTDWPARVRCVWRHRDEIQNTLVRECN